MEPNKVTKIALLVALFMIPISSIPLHISLHADIFWINYVVLFDAIIVTALFYFQESKFWAFWLNTVLATAGIIFHMGVGIISTLTEIALGIADIAVGLALFYVSYETVKVVGKRKK